MLVLIIGKTERIFKRLIFILQRERIIAGKVMIHREQKENFADAEMGGVDFREHLGESQRVGRTSMPGIAGGTRIEVRESGQRVQVFREQLDEFRTAVSA